MCKIRTMHERQTYIYSFSTEDIRYVLTSLLRSYAVHLRMHPTDSDMHRGKHPSSLWRRITLSCVKRILFSGTKEIFPLAEQFSNTEVRVFKHGRDEQRHLLFMSMDAHSLETEGTLVVHHFRVNRLSLKL